MLNLPEIEPGAEGFDALDWLNRKPIANRLSELVDRLPDPLVIALDGEWGSGKSHFLKMWVREHQIWLKEKYGDKKGANIIYFDAFKHDYLDDPLASLVIRMKENPAIGQITAEKIIPVAKKILRNIHPALNAGIDALDALQSSTWEQEEARVAAMEKFRFEVSALAENEKVIFIIDEIDRCRPDYALNLLEIIKHFFNAQNIHFILGANFQALESSVKAAYGEDIGAAQYLKKFVNFFMRLDFRPLYEDQTVIEVYFSKLLEKVIESGHPLGKRENLISATQVILGFPVIKKTISLRDINYLVSRMMLLPANNLDLRKTPISLFASSVAILEAIDREAFKNLLAGTLDKNFVAELFYTDENDPFHSDSTSVIDTLHHVLDENHDSKSGPHIYGVASEEWNRRLHIRLRENLINWFTIFQFQDSSEVGNAGT